jgi:hypothetical protein
MSKIVKSLTAKMMTPKRVLALPGDKADLVLGNIIGVAMGLSTSQAADGSILTGLKGRFAFISADEAACSSVEAGQFWPPSGFLEDVFHLLDRPREDRPDMVRFAFKIGVEKRDNPAGYGYFMESLLAPTEGNPLEELMQVVAAPGIKQIEETKTAVKKEKTA